MGDLDRLEGDAPTDREFLRTVRDSMKVIVANDLAAEALRLCRVIRGRDLYIGAPPPRDPNIKSITLKHPGMCQKCGQAMPVGEHATWQHGVGTWHPACWLTDHPGEDRDS